MTDHISDRVSALLLADGWTRRQPLPVEQTGCAWAFRKAHHTGGAIGRAIVTLRICQSGRWLERVDGWGKVERCADLRDWSDDPAGAIALVMGRE